MKQPMPFNYARFLNDTGAMSVQEVGAYILLIAEHYMTGPRGLPADDEMLAKLTKTTLEEWQSIKNAVMSHFIGGEKTWFHEGVMGFVLNSGRPEGSVWEKTRREVFKRDKFTCSYCGKESRDLECDHVYPISKGGTHDVDNLTTACSACNRSKGAKTREEWGLH